MLVSTLRGMFVCDLATQLKETECYLCCNVVQMEILVKKVSTKFDSLLPCLLTLI